MMHIPFQPAVLFACIASIFALPCAAADSAETVSASDYRRISVALPAVTVHGARADKPFQTPAAVSRRNADELGQDINTIIRSMPGTFTQHDIGQGGFAVNIRGMEGLGRVNTTVDGVTQTFYQANPAHGWNGSTAYVDENFIAGVEVARGSVAGAAGANALSGTAEFRTIDVDDLVAKDRRFGFQTTYRQGSNGYGSNGMVGLAARHDFDDGGSIGFLSAFSGKRKTGYKNGAGETIAADSFDAGTPLESGVRSWSSLNKIQIRPGKAHNLILSHLYNRSRFTNNHSPLQVKSQTGLAKYRYKPLNDRIDLRTDLSYADTRQTFLSGENADESYVGRTTRNPSLAFTLQNRSLFDAGGSDLAVNYGSKLIRTRYNSNHDDKLLLAEGKQTLDSIFADAEWNPGRWTLSGGLRYERYGMQGYIPPTDDNGAILLPRGGNVRFNRKEGRLNPHLGIAYRPLDWLQVYANIGKSSRAPNVQEFMYMNNAGGNPYSVNPYLKSESAFNRDFGFNILKHGLWRTDDALRLKVGRFDNRIKNYILQNQFYVCGEDDLSRCTLDDYLAGSNRIEPVGVFTNIPDTTRMRGWEVEGGYDFGRAYVNLSWSKTKTNFPPDYLADLGFSHIRSLPESVWTVDAGTRWLNNKLVVGARLSYTGADTVAGGIDSDTDKQTTAKVAANPKLVDLYATYQAGKNLKLFFNIDNLTNRIYNYPLSGGTLGSGNLGDGNNANRGTGRGRTFYGGLTLKF